MEMKNSEIKVSVIIPVYNVENVIHRCLDALKSQTLSDVEYIFVDDCCKDSTVEVIKRSFESLDRSKSYKIIHHEYNRGVAAARNTGLAHSQGKYVYYVDSDDYIDKNTLDLLYNEAESCGADVVGCEWYLTFESNERHVKQADAKTGEELFKSFANGVARWNLWLFIVKRSLYETNNIHFIEKMNMGEDMMVMMKLALHADKVSMLHTPLYHYIQTNSNSLTKNFIAYRHQVTANAESVAEYLNEIGRGDLASEVMQLKLTLKLPLLISNKKSDYMQWLEWFPESNAEAGKNKYQPFRTRFIQLVASKHQFWLLKLYYYLVMKVVYGIIYR